MKLIVLSMLISIAAVYSTHANADHPESTSAVKIGDNDIIEIEHSEGFNKMKQMLGTWEGKLTQNTGTVIDTRSEFKLVCGGNLITEILTEDGVEMLTTYSDNKDGELVVKHYCALGTQPAFKLANASSNSVSVTLDESQGGYHPEHHSYVQSMQWTVDAKTGNSAVVDTTLYLDGELIEQQAIISKVN